MENKFKVIIGSLKNSNPAMLLQKSEQNEIMLKKKNWAQPGCCQNAVAMAMKNDLNELLTLY